MDNLGLREDADRAAILDNLRAADLPLDLHNFPPIISRIRRFVGNRRFALDVPAAFEVVADIGLEESLSLNYSISAAQEAVGCASQEQSHECGKFPAGRYRCSGRRLRRPPRHRRGAFRFRGFVGSDGVHVAGLLQRFGEPLVATKNSESGEKSRVSRVTAAVRPTCLSSCVSSFHFIEIRDEASRQLAGRRPAFRSCVA